MNNKELVEKILSSFDFMEPYDKECAIQSLNRMAEEKDKEINEAVHFIINEQKEQISELKAEVEKLRKKTEHIHTNEEHQRFRRENQEEFRTSDGYIPMTWYSDREFMRMKNKLKAVLDKVEKKISEFMKAKKGITNQQILKHWDTFILHLEELKHNSKEAGES